MHSCCIDIRKIERDPYFIGTFSNTNVLPVRKSNIKRGEASGSFQILIKKIRTSIEMFDHHTWKRNWLRHMDSTSSYMITVYDDRTAKIEPEGCFGIARSWQLLSIEKNNNYNYTIFFELLLERPPVEVTIFFIFFALADDYIDSMQCFSCLRMLMVGKQVETYIVIVSPHTVFWREHWYSPIIIIVRYQTSDYYCIIIYFHVSHNVEWLYNAEPQKWFILAQQLQ